MRKIERQMNFALSNKGNFSSSNTSVSYHPSENLSEVRLHGNLIAWLDHTKQVLALSSAGWHTNTTKSRLNALLFEFNTGISVFQKNWDWFVSDFSGKKKVDFYDGILVTKEGFSSIHSHPAVA
tara:strand:- start:2487 stop:2858 length:372 start_codon:yes stop_codon:yes gene_type:complete